MSKFSLPLCLYPGETFGLPSGRASSVTLVVERTFKSVLDVEAGAVACLRQRNRCGARACARAAEQKQGRAGPVTGPFERIHDLLHECAVRGWREVLPFAQHRLTLQRCQIRYPDEIPFRHGAHVDELCGRLAREPLPGLPRGKITRITHGG